MKRKLASVVGAFVATSVMASAAIPTTELTTAITDGVTAGETLIGAGLAVTALFILAKIIKKGAARIG